MYKRQGQALAVGQPWGHAAHNLADGMGEAGGGVAEGDAGEHGRLGHPLPQLHVAGVVHQPGQGVDDKSHGPEADHLGVGGGAVAQIALKGVGEGVKARDGGHPGRQSAHQLRVDDGLLGEGLVVEDALLVVVLLV